MRHNGEFAIIDRLARIFGRPASPSLGIGDDAALFRPRAGYDLVWTTDSHVENVHFKSAWLSAEEIGWRAAAAALSDIAAMGAKPRFALVTFHISRRVTGRSIESTARGMQRIFRRFDTQVLGGNISRDRTFSIEISVVGEVRRGRSVTRSGARPGDYLYVTGIPGLSALGLSYLRRGTRGTPARKAIAKYKRPVPRFDAMARVASAATAAIDVSDGLIQDACHLARASRVDLEIDLRPIPQRASDDYELLVTLPRSAPSPKGFRRIGRVLRGDGKVFARLPNGKTRMLRSPGWEH